MGTAVQVGTSVNVGTVKGNSASIEVIIFAGINPKGDHGNPDIEEVEKV